MATAYYNTTSGMNNGNEMIRTDIFPYFSTPPTTSSFNGSSSSDVSDIDEMVTKMKLAQSSISNTSSTTTTTSSSSFPYYDMSSNPTPLDWSSTSMINTTTGLGSSELPPSSLSMKRDDSDSFVGRQSGFGLFNLDEIDAAPANANNNSSTTLTSSTGVKVEGLNLAFDVAPVVIPSPFSSSSSVFSTNDYNSLSFDSYNNSSMIGNMSSMVPSSTTNTNLGASSPSMSSQSSSAFSSFEDSSMEPDAYSVSDVDAASDVSDAWSVGSAPHSPSSPVSSVSSPSIAPSVSSSSSSSGLPSITSYTTSLYGRPMPATIARPTPLTETQLAELATRPGPYTRGRAAALAAPIGGPRELKPVPVARGPHAGVLGGGEMASVGIYTKDDRWRKIERLREKRRARIVVAKSSGGQYACRKSFADRRPRVGGRFVKMDDETKRYLALTKPGAAPAPVSLEPSAALKAYAAQQHAAHNASSLSSPNMPNVVVNAAHVASQSYPNEALFGNDMSSQPPMPSYPLVNTTNSMDSNSTSIGTWYTFPSTQITVGA